MLMKCPKMGANPHIIQSVLITGEPWTALSSQDVSQRRSVHQKSPPDFTYYRLYD